MCFNIQKLKEFGNEEVDHKETTLEYKETSFSRHIPTWNTNNQVVFIKICVFGRLKRLDS